MTAQRRVFSTSNPPCTQNGQDGPRFVHRKVKLKSRCVEFTIENADSDLRNGVRTCTDLAQWLDFGRLPYESSACALSLPRNTRGKTHSSLPSPPPSCAWKPPEMKGPYRGLMRPFVCIRFHCEFHPEVKTRERTRRAVRITRILQDLRLMWHKKSSWTRIDHDRGRNTDRNFRPPGSTGKMVMCVECMIGYSILEIT